ncbi:MAG TPA: CsgG/HfaB family protein [Burkholderiaceae bacterium]|jgi:curli biogenesis system outer membrane secretion channel CsgG|nr:CsgG/HfaB family protein [Burkholderiaceae bacterium]
MMHQRTAGPASAFAGSPGSDEATPHRSQRGRTHQRFRFGWLIATWVAVSLCLFAAIGHVHAQGKPRVAVTAFENKVKTPWWDASWRIGEGLAEMLATELTRTGQFIVLERQAIGDVVGEQALGQSGLVRRDTAAAAGQMLGAQYVVRGAITQFEEQAGGGGVGIQGRNTAFEGRAQFGHVGLDLRLVDTTSGQIVASHHVAVRVPGAGGAIASQGRSVRFGGDIFFQTPIGQATRAAMQEAVQFVVTSMPRSFAAPSYSLVKVDGPTAYLNAGANANVRVGDVLQVYSRGEELTDPATGLKLGAVERPVGTIQVIEVHEQFSVATVRQATGPLRRGDSIRMR